MATTGRAVAALLREWRLGPADRTAFLLSLTDDEIERVSRVSISPGHPLRLEARDFLRAIYALD